MKKVITTFLVALSSIVYSFAQSIHILNGNKDVTNTVIVVPISKGDSTAVEMSLQNKTSSKISYKVNRTILNPPMNDTCSSLYF